MNYFFGTIWKYWRAFGEFLGDMVGRFFLMGFYLTIAAPFALITMLTNDYLRVKKDKAGWVERPDPDTSIEAGYSQGLS